MPAQTPSEIATSPALLAVGACSVAAGLLLLAAERAHAATG